MTAIELPYPPSVNALYRAVKGRSMLSAEYRAWRNEARFGIMLDKPEPCHGPVTILVELAPRDKRRRDLDNAGFKAVLDMLVECGLIDGDDGRTVREITARWVESDKPCVVTYSPVEIT